MQIVTFQRTLQYLRTDRLVKMYSQFSQKNYEGRDVLGGSQHWCDFESDSEWGECTSVFQNGEEAAYIHQQLYTIDISVIEATYGITIDPNTIPAKTDETRHYLVDTFQGIENALYKKLNQAYPYQKNNFSQKGTLLIGINDPAFGGFENDPELNKEKLQSLSCLVKTRISDSSFAKVLLVDELAGLNDDPANTFYLL